MTQSAVLLAVWTWMVGVAVCMAQMPEPTAPVPNGAATPVPPLPAVVPVPDRSDSGCTGNCGNCGGCDSCGNRHKHAFWSWLFYCEPKTHHCCDCCHKCCACGHPPLYTYFICTCYPGAHIGNGLYCQEGQPPCQRYALCPPLIDAGAVAASAAPPAPPSPAP
jgi:hypothetical protein